MVEVFEIRQTRPDRHKTDSVKHIPFPSLTKHPFHAILTIGYIYVYIGVCKQKGDLPWKEKQQWNI